jgi:hypothetical protein
LEIDNGAIIAVATVATAVAAIVSAVLFALANTENLWKAPHLEAEPTDDAYEDGRVFKITLRNDTRQPLAIFSLWITAEPWGLMALPVSGQKPQETLQLTGWRLEPNEKRSIDVWLGSRERRPLGNFTLGVVYSRNGVAGRRRKTRTKLASR